MIRHILIAFGFMLALAACGEQQAAEMPDAVRPVKLVTVEATSNRFDLSYPAIIEAAQSSDLAFQVSGLLEELPVENGELVQKGDLIARLDQTNFRNSYNSAKAQFDNAESAYQRAVRLSEQDAISTSILEQRQSARDTAKASLDSAAKALRDTGLMAPFTGQVAVVHVQNFQNVNAQQAIVTLQSVGDVEAVIDIPARIIAYVPQIQPEGTSITLDAAPDAPLPAVFKEASAAADPTTQTYKAYFTFTPPENLLILPGMTGTVDTTMVYSGNDLDNNVSIPLGSILAEGEGKYVWRVDLDTMRVAKTPVDVREDRFGEMVTILEGLTAGDVIVGAGAAYLHEGMQVRDWDTK